DYYCEAWDSSLTGPIF
nr:immunoglobulin light chain junction region [Macaca mulatta]